MPDIAILPLAAVGLIVVAGGGGWLARTIMGRRKAKNAE
jgi:hypothetical protein